MRSFVQGNSVDRDFQMEAPQSSMALLAKGLLDLL
jgi:hypothetical protein